MITEFFEHGLNVVDPPVFEIPQDCSTGHTHEGSSRALETVVPEAKMMSVIGQIV